jgi:hypothetical protein
MALRVAVLLPAATEQCGCGVPEEKSGSGLRFCDSLVCNSEAERGRGNARELQIAGLTQFLHQASRNSTCPGSADARRFVVSTGQGRRVDLHWSVVRGRGCIWCLETLDCVHPVIADARSADPCAYKSCSCGGGAFGLLPPGTPRD